MLAFVLFLVFLHIYIYIYIYFFFPFCFYHLCHDDVGKYFLFTCLGSYVDMSILACFHMYIHVGMKVHIHIYVCELHICIITFSHICPCEENLILGSIDERANAVCYEN